MTGTLHRGAALLGSAALLLLLLTGCGPALPDVTTDLDRPPVYFVPPPAQRSYDAAAFRTLQAQAYPELHNLETPWPLDEAFARVLTVIRRREWTIVGVEEKRHRVQMIAMMPVLRLRDDVVIEVRDPPARGDAAVKSEIVMRSKSRLDWAELGGNARRIRAFFRDLQAAP